MRWLNPIKQVGSRAFFPSIEISKRIRCGKKLSPLGFGLAVVFRGDGRCSTNIAERS
jgi:hypothetical protein